MKLNLKVSPQTSAFFAKLVRGGTGYYMDPIRDWTIGLFVAVAAFIVGVSFIAFDFYTQMHASEVEIVIEDKPVVYQERDVIRFAELYTERERSFNELRKIRSVVTQPSAQAEKELPAVSNELNAPLASEEEEQYTDPAPEEVQ